MMERYSKLFSLPQNLYAAGAPVIIAAGSLLKDTQTGKVLSQLKLKSVSPKMVKAVKVTIFPLDTVNKPLDGETTYEYLDLSVERDGEFGQKTAIFLPNVSTRAFSVEVTEVDFADNSVWTSEGEVWEPLPVPEPVGDFELTKQYKMHFGEKAQYKPVRDKDVWICACGEVNSEKEAGCHTCGNKLSELLTCNLKKLTIEKDQRLAREKVEQEAKIAADKAAAEMSAKNAKKILAVVISVLVCIVAVLVIIKVAIPNSNYNKAKALLDAGQYEEAVAAFEALNGYKDSAEQIKAAEDAKAEAEIEARYLYAVSCIQSSQYIDAMTTLTEIEGYKDSSDLIASILPDYYKQLWSGPNVGDIICFGTYEQDDNESNGAEDIEWLVLAKDGEKILVISRHAIDCRQFNKSGRANWESSDIRKWLNNDFIASALNINDRSLIVTTVTMTEDNEDSSSILTSEDQVFLLSLSEAEEFFESNKAREFKPTKYAESIGKRQKDQTTSFATQTCWLRSPGRYSDHVSTVYSDGTISDLGSTVWFYYLVRPVMWIDLG